MVQVKKIKEKNGIGGKAPMPENILFRKFYQIR